MVAALDRYVTNYAKLVGAESAVSQLVDFVRNRLLPHPGKRLHGLLLILSVHAPADTLP
ncbi:Protein of unknown function [Thiomonas sp. CB2]|jgi:hypothetical protein|nr:Protein of unknown function [Thiomonas sp. CB2]VDY04347.1 protein of unknown function [Thiomonas sp. Bio17B3]VDY08480.1 protein of unknown function [Thiomonas sp. Sup16B3]VDY12592.1 conserved protein of unknown function [Thiomonas sp. OC7]VDY18196.1 Protein of unknown function [Thiomonas sp. CB2]